LQVYSTLEVENINDFKKAFEAENRDVEIVWLRDATGVVTAKILAEQNAQRGDAIWGLAVTSTMQLKARGLLEPYAPKNVSALKPSFRDPADPPFYTGMEGWVAAVCFNTIEGQKLSLPKPVSWFDLLDAKYRGKITMPHPASSGTGYFHVSAWIQMWGEEKAWAFMDKLHDNIAVYEHSGSRPCRHAAAGEYPLGIAYELAAASAKQKGAPIEGLPVLAYFYTAPKEGSEGGWVLMGGAYRHAGNTAPTTEWNIHCDPEAAKIAFTEWGASARAHGHGLPVALGLDVTEKAKILPDHVVELARRAGSTPDDSIVLARGQDPMHATLSVASNPVVRFIADALRYYMEFHSRYDGFYGAFIHDPLATAAALDPSLVRTEALAVDVELDGTLTAGETVTDWRRVWGRSPNVDVAVEADAEEFLRRFVERVGGLASRLATAQT